MPARFVRIPSASGVQRSGRMTLGFKSFLSYKATKHASETDEYFFVNDHFPTFRNENADCLRTGLLSILHHTDPECLLDMKNLRSILTGGRHVGTDIASAALFLNVLGIRATAYASTLDRVPAEMGKLAHDYGLLRKKKLTWATMRSAINAGCGVLCCVDVSALCPNAEGLHSMLITGFSESGKALTVHDSARPPEEFGSHGEENSLRLWREMTKGWAAHDHHALIVEPKLSVSLKKHRRYVLAALKKGSGFFPSLVAASQKQEQLHPLPEEPAKPAGLVPAQTISTIPFADSPTRKAKTAAAVVSAMRHHDRLFCHGVMPVDRWMRRKSAKNPDIADAARTLVRFGYTFEIHGELTAEQRKRIGRPVKAFRKQAAMRTLCKALGRNAVPLLTVDTARLYGNKLKPEWNMVAMAGWYPKQVIYHDTGHATPNGMSMPYQKEARKAFNRARAPGANALIVTGHKPHKISSRWLFQDLGQKKSLSNLVTTEAPAPTPAPAQKPAHTPAPEPAAAYAL